LLTEQKDITGKTSKHIGGSAVHVVGSSMQVIIENTNFRKTMSAAGAVYIWNLVGGISSVNITGGEMTKNHGLIASALTVKSEVDITVSVTSVTLEGNIISANRQGSELLSLASGTMFMTVPRPISPGFTHTISQCTMKQNFGAGLTIILHADGGNILMHQNTIEGNGNMIYSKYEYSLWKDLFPSAAVPETSGLTQHMILANNLYDFTATRNTLTRNFVSRLLFPTKFFATTSFFHMIKLDDNTVTNLWSQVGLGETGEWGLNNEDTSLNLNWKPVTSLMATPSGGLVGLAYASKAPFCEIHIINNTFENLPLTGVSQLTFNVTSGSAGSTLLQTFNFSGNQFINVATITFAGPNARLMWIRGCQDLYFENNLFDNRRWQLKQFNNDPLDGYTGPFTFNFQLIRLAEDNGQGITSCDGNVIKGFDLDAPLILFMSMGRPVTMRRTKIINTYITGQPIFDFRAPIDIALFEDITMEDSKGQLASVLGSGPSLKVILMNSIFVRHDFAEGTLIGSAIRYTLVLNNLFIDNFNTKGPIFSQDGGSLKAYSNAFLFHKRLGNGAIFQLTKCEFSDEASLYIGNGSGNRGGVLFAVATEEVILKNNLYYDSYAVDSGAVLYASSGSEIISENNKFVHNGAFESQYNLPEIDEFRNWRFTFSFDKYFTMLTEFVKFSPFYGSGYLEDTRKKEASYTTFAERSQKTIKEYLDDLALTPSTSTLVQDTLVKNGGAVTVDSQSSIQSTNDKFEGNSAKSASVFRCSSSKQAESVFKHSQIINNEAKKVENAGGDATMKVVDCKVTLDDVDMNNNEAQTLATGLLVMTSDLMMTGSRFSNQGSEDAPGFVRAVSGSSLDVDDCNFENGTDAITLSQASVVSLKASTFKNNQGVVASALNSFLSADITIRDCLFEGNTASREIADIRVVRATNLKILENTRITGINTNGRIQISDTKDVELNSLKLDGGIPPDQEIDAASSTSNRASAVQLISCDTIKIIDSLFHRTYAKNGAGITIDNTLLTASQRSSATALLQSSTLKDNRAQENGGGLRLINVPSLKVQETTFEDNLAIAGSGGAIHSLCPKEKCTLEFLSPNTENKVKFSSNRAHITGGAIFWNEEKEMSGMASVTFTGNTAVYGPDKGGAAYAVVPVPNDTTYNVELDKIKPQVLLTNVRSGSRLKDFFFAIVDQYGQVVKTDSTSSAQILGNKADTNEGGFHRIQNGRDVADSGFFNFANAYIAYEPLSQGDYTVASDDIGQTGAPDELSEFKIDFRACEVGEVKQDNICFWCGSEVEDTNTEAKKIRRYSVDPTDTACRECPSNAYCWGGSTLGPREGYWRMDATTTEILECPNESACLGAQPGVDADLPTGRCDTDNGYTGSLCRECLDGYTPVERSTCSKCPPAGLNALKLTVLTGAILALGFFIVKNSLSILNPATHRKNPSKYTRVATHLRILTNYLQLVSLTSAIEMNWPAEIIGLFTAHEYLGSISEQLFSYSCFLESDGRLPVVYFRTLLLNMVPLMILILAAILWGLKYYFSQERDLTKLKTAMVCTTVVVVFMMHSSIMKQNLSMFSCRTLSDGNLYLSSDLSLECWDGEHFAWVFAVTIPGTIIWVIGAPVVAFLVLQKNSGANESTLMKAKYGFLVAGFEPQFYYWELIILGRKFAVACVAVFFPFLDKSIQGLIGLAVLMPCYHLHETMQPYLERELNNLEAKSLFVTLITIYCGMCFLAEDLSAASRITLVLLMLGANLYFFISLTKRAGKELVNMWRKKFYNKGGKKYSAVAMGAGPQLPKRKALHKGKKPALDEDEKDLELAQKLKDPEPSRDFSDDSSFMIVSNKSKSHDQLHSMKPAKLKF